MNKIKRCFLNVNMAMQHDGLTALAKEHKVSLPNLDDGEHVVFINRAKNRLKLYSKGNVIHYLRLEGNRTIDLNTVQIIPDCLKGQKIDYDMAIKKTLERELQ